MTDKDWKYVKEQITHSLGVQLKCDEYMLTLRVGRIAELKLGIVFYINGEFKGEWLTNDCEIRRRFARPVNKSIHTTKEKNKLRKMGKKFLKDCNIDLEKKITFYQFYWTNFNSLKRHLIKNNTKIKLLW